MSVTKKQARKFGLFIAISMVIGTLIGIGIFFKNISVFKSTGSNPTTTLVAWILSGVIALCAAISFSEVGTTAAGKNGLALYAEKLIGKKAKNIILVVNPIIFLALLTFALSIFSAEAIFMTIENSGLNSNSFSIKEHMGFILLLGAGLFLLFSSTNVLSKKIGCICQIISTGLKLIPLVLVIIIGFISPGKDVSSSFFVTGGTKPFNMSTVIALSPTILFAFYGFTTTMDMGDDVKNPKKTISLAVFFGMLFTLIFYILVTIAQLYSGEATTTSIIKLVSSQPWIYRLFWILLSIGAMGVLNGLTMAYVNSTNLLIQEELLPGSRWLKSIKTKDSFKSLFVILIVFTIIFCMFGIPSIIMNSDAIIDAVSNMPVVLSFLIYLIILTAHFINRTKIQRIQFKNGFKIHRYNNHRVKFQGINSLIYYAATIFALIGLVIVISYQLIQPLIDLKGPTKVVFGVFANGGKHYNWEWTNWQFLLLNCSIITLTILPCIGSYFYNKKQWIKNKA